MKYKYIKQQYLNLESFVFEALKNEINNSNQYSKFCNNKVIKTNVFNYVELMVMNGDLVFIDEKGYRYSIYADCSLEDLIDILCKLEDNSSELKSI